MPANKVSSRKFLVSFNSISAGVFGTPIPVGVESKMPFTHISRNNNPSDIKLGKDAPYIEMTDDFKDFPYVQTTDD